MKATKRIIAMGGGGFTMEAANPLLDDYVLEKSPASKPRICLLPTASGDHEEYIQRFYDLFSTRSCFPSHLTLFRPRTRPADAIRHILNQDIIYVSGGHTETMIKIWRAYGVDQCLFTAWERGILLAGVSSGGVCWFQEGVTDSNPDGLDREECLGFLPGSFCAHYENEGRRPTFHRLIRDGRLMEGIGVENFSALYFNGVTIHEVVSSRPGAQAYRVLRREGGIEELPLHNVFLGDAGHDNGN